MNRHNHIVLDLDRCEPIGLALGQEAYRATQVGQVLISVDGDTFKPELPVTSRQGWLVNNEGILIVNG